MDHTTRCVDYQPLRSGLRRQHRLRTTLGTQHGRAIVEFGETLLCMPPQHKSLPKAELRMQKCIWLVKVSETGENYVATEQGVAEVRTVRRLQPGFKHDLALLNKITGTPWSPRRNTYDPKFMTLLETTALRPPSQSPRPPQRDAGQQTHAEDDVPQPPPSKQARTTAGPVLPSTRPTTESSSSQLPDSHYRTTITTTTDQHDRSNRNYNPIAH